MDIWEDEFYLEIEEREVPGDWEFYEEEDLSVEERGLKYTQRTYGRFRCSGCRRTWYSAEVHILFLISLNKALQEGTMKMRIFRQECKKCNFPKLENPEISQENITRIIKNVVNRILQVFYGEKKAQQDLRPEIYSNDMEGPHESEHCEACKFMICKWQIVASENQSAVKNFPAQTRAAPEPNKQKKSKNRKSKGKKSSYGSTSTGSNQQSSYNCQPTTTYSDYKTYPNSEPDSEHLGYTEYVSACTNSVPAQSKVETKTHNSTAQTKAAPQQNNQKKSKNRKSKGKKSSYGSTSTGSYQKSSYNCEPTTTYSDYPSSERDSEYLGYTEYVSASTYPVPAQSKVETKTQKKKKRQSKKSSHVSTYTASYPLSSSYCQPTTNYSYYEYPCSESDYEYLDYEKYAAYPETYTASSLSRKKEASSFPVLASLVAGLAALTLWYLKK